MIDFHDDPPCNHVGALQFSIAGDEHGAMYCARCGDMVPHPEVQAMLDRAKRSSLGPGKAYADGGFVGEALFAGIGPQLLMGEQVIPLGDPHATRPTRADPLDGHVTFAIRIDTSGAQSMLLQLSDDLQRALIAPLRNQLKRKGKPGWKHPQRRPDWPVRSLKAFARERASLAKRSAAPRKR